jgi:hypothetical protein
VRVAVAAAVAVLAGGCGGDARKTGSTPTAAKGEVTLTWVGDITLGSSHGNPPDRGRGLFSGVRDVLRRADVTVGNLEGTLSSGGVSKCAGEEPSPDCFAFQAPPENAGALRYAGFDLMNLANNHAFDFGAEGLQQTIEALDGQRIESTGAPGQIVVRRVNGLRLAFVGFAPYVWASPLDDLVTSYQLIKSAAGQADVVIVLMHAGAEGADQTHTPEGLEYAFGENRGETRSFARLAVDAGADLVLGSGPHVVRGIERYHDRLIAYSLGNFAGYKNFGMGGALSLSGILEVRVAGDGSFLEGRWHSVVLREPGQPVLDPAHTSAELVDKLSHEDFTGVFHMEPDGTLTS